MELVSLEIERFGRVARTSIGFKPGLNVLHGANEVGKSSIARAIRFALLLPASSTAVEPWVPWHGGGDPAVTLVFRKGSTEYFRVKKVFGTSTASLERSSDGVGWVGLARAREVEAKLRALLEWGIAEPGPKAQKGLPESFLASALLADQHEVASIFDQTLENDGVDSGRSRIRAALQAMAQDPLFKAVLAAAQARVDEAFSPKGDRKRGTGTPFKKMADDIAARQSERDEAEQAAGAARLLAQRVQELQRQAATAEANLQEATEQRVALEQRRTRQLALATATASRNTGQALVDAVTEAENKVQTAERVLQELQPRIPMLREAEEEARAIFQAATADAAASRDRQRGELALEETAILRERGVLRSRQTRLEAALALRKAETLREQGDELAEALKTLDDEIKSLDAVESWTELGRTRTSLKATAQRAAAAAELLAKATDLRSRAAQEWPSADSKLLPDAKRVVQLRELRQGLDVAEAKLHVGLCVEVRGPRSVSVSLDGAAAEERTSPFSVEAKASARLNFVDGVEVLVRGGRLAEREDADRRRKQWNDMTASLFATVGVTDFAALEETCRLDAERKTRAENLEREAATTDSQRVALGDSNADRERYEERIAELALRLEGVDLALVESAASAYGVQVRAVLTKKATGRESKRQELATLRAQEATLRERAAADLAGDAIGDLDAEVKAIGAATEDLDSRERKLVEARGVLDAPPGRRDALENAVSVAKLALDEAVSRTATATSERDVWGARLQERRAAATKIDIASLQRAEDAARAAARDDGAPVHEATIVGACAAEEDAKTRNETLTGELRKAEGALLASGGAAADERLHDVEAALQRAHERQSALEDDYESWRLLSDTLKDAERAQATHLGNVLAPDLGARFQALAGQRYNGIALGPHLGLDGVEAGGARRALDRLSIGTREQLSTLFRLCLAERLGSALLLDDQLVQSDLERLRWFRRALRQTASTGVQIVVLTCRPDDYLEPAESPGPHVVDLASIVTDGI